MSGTSNTLMTRQERGTGVIPELSQTLVEEYLRCGLRWQFRQDPHHGRYSTIPITIGVSVDRASHEDCQAKLREQQLPLQDIVDLAVTEYGNQAAANEYTESRWEIGRGKDSTVAAAVAYATHTSPLIERLHCSQKRRTVRLVLPSGREVDFAGTPDYETEDGLGDLKCGKKWQRYRAVQSRQLTAYGLLYLNEHGHWPAHVWIDNVFHERNRWSAQRIWATRSDADYRAFLHILERAVDGMEQGVILPAPEAAWYCSPKWCPFYRRCPAVGV